MALTTDFNVDPYYDDYDETKSFYRILFRPGYAVQAREVTQLQTILQKQIERNGRHIFDEGSIVVGCELNYDNKVKSLKLETQFSGADLTIDSFANGIVTGATSNARGKIVATSAATTSDQPTLMFHYLNNNSFNDGETITVEGTTTQANTVSTTGASGLSDTSSNGSVVSINTGVFYVGGFFVFKDAESLILEKYSETPSYRVGLQVTESTVTSDSDSALLDPAQGAYNYAAQGANRYKLALTLSAKTFTATDPVENAADDNFYQLLKVSNGDKLEETKYPVYSELEKTLARRTFDESGDYTVTPFNLQLAPHQGITGRTINAQSTSTVAGVGTNFISDFTAGDVVYLSGDTTALATISEITTATAATLSGVSSSFDANTPEQTIQFESKFSAGLDPGKAYVKGYEYESLGTKYVTIDKGRDTLTVNTYGTSTALGNKLYVKNANGHFNINTHAIIDLHCANVTSQSVGSSSTTTHPNGTTVTDHAEKQARTKIGTARIRDMDFYAASGNTGNTSHSHSDYILYLYDVRTTNNKTGNVADSNSTSTVVQIGSSTDVDGTSANTHHNFLAQIDDAYVGATIKITTPKLNKVVGEDLSTFQMEDSQTHGGNNGILILEEQTSANGVANVTDTRIITGYSGNSTKAFVTCNTALSERTYYSATSAGALEAGLGSTYDITFQLKDLESVAYSNTSTSPSRKASADVDELSRYNGISTANAVLKETQFNSLVFPLPDSPIKMVANVEFTYKATKTGTLDGDKKLDISLPSGDFWTHSDGTLTTSQAEEGFILVGTTADTVGQTTTGVKTTAGQYLSFSSTDGVLREVSISGGVASVKANTGSSIDVAVTYTAKSNNISGSARSKGITVASYTNNYTAGATLTAQIARGQYLVAAPSRTVNQKIELPVSDVFNIVKIVDSGDVGLVVSNTMMIASANNISSSYTLDTGQTDNYYGHSAISLKPGSHAPTGQIVIVYDRFTHPGSAGFFSANSYDTIVQAGTVYNGGLNNFKYSDIPSYTSPVSGESYKLTDVVDFRPLVQDNTPSTTYDIATNIDSVLSTTIKNPDSDTTSILDYSYYLPRIDKLVLTRDRQFEVIRGKADTNPVAPSDDDDSMTLFTLKIPAYTFALTDIETRYIDNKRFTMRDIGKLEKRVERLEYFTSLSILEKETEARDITSDNSRDSLFNSTGSRFKNGILVDPFAGHSIGDVSSDDYNNSVHFSKKQLRPAFYSDNFRFEFDESTSNNATKTGDLITLPYTNSTFIEQPLTSNTTSINPFNIVNFIGNLELAPPSDTWYDQTTRPEVTTNVEGHHDNWTLSPNDGRIGFGSQWDDWTVNWTGKQINPEPNDAVSNAGTTFVKTRSTNLSSQNKSKFGIQSDNPVETIVKTVGNRILDMSVVPFVRSQRISFAAQGMKPLSNVYVYIGSTDMSANTEPAKKLVLGSANGAFQNGEIIKDSANNRGVVRVSSNTVSNIASIFITDITGNTSATAASQVTLQNNRISNSTIGFVAANVVTGLTSGSNGTISTIVSNTRGILVTGVSKMQTNDQGEIAGDINVPAGTFRAGDRIVRITDHANNELATTTTVAEKLFKSKGLLQNREKLIISTREPVLRRESIGDEGVVTDTTSRQTNQSSWINPMAQSIFVDPSTYPMGLFLKDVTLWFSGKDVNLPVTVQIRPMVNGFPSSSLILPFSEITLNPDKVQTSATANAATSNTTTSTTFTFESPVYLTPDEYAITILSNSTEYKLYTAKFGLNATGTSRKISKQPFVGSFFRPQNAGTWEAIGEEFAMMKINRCDFTGTGGANNYARFNSHANSASGNTANVNYQTFKTTTSTIQFSNTTADFTYNSANTANAYVGYTTFSTDQNITLANTRMMTMNTNGMFLINCTMSTSNSHVSPVIDVDRMSLITIDNDVDDAVISANDVTVTSRGAGYQNTAPGSYTATFSTPDLGSNTATVNVHIEVTLTIATTNTKCLASGNSSYTVNNTNPAHFVIGEGIRTVAASPLSDPTTPTQSAATARTGLTDAAIAIISGQRFIDDDPTKNVSSITVRTNANSFGVFANGTYIQADDGSSVTSAQALTVSGVTGSNTFAIIAPSGGVSGLVANVVPWPASSATAGSTGSGYLTTPTITISSPWEGTDVATANVTGEDSSTGGNINTKYISRRVTLEDGFDSSDLKVIMNAYKPLGTGIHVYYKVKSDEDPEDFDKKGYVLMSQETANSVYSLSEEDTKEFVYQTSGESISYTSANVEYDKFKTFSVKIALTSNSAAVIPKVRDMRAIALDT